MKFFVTGRSSNYQRVKDVFIMIESAGHEITLKWTDLPMIKPYNENEATAGIYSEQQLKGVESSDIYIIFAHSDGNGVFTEFGAALAYAQLRGTPKIYAIGDVAIKSSAMFYYHPLINWRDTVEEILKEVVFN